MTERPRLRSLLAVVAMVGTIGQSLPARALPCAQQEEARAFNLRHLQSRLMVAALSCDQKDAYNGFVKRFLNELSSGGKTFVAYFQRTGLGAPGLNKHVTDLANAAGHQRAVDPNAYCEKTWQMFWDLDQTPERFAAIARESVVTALNPPEECSELPAPVASKLQVAPKPKAQKKTAAPKQTEAAVK